MRWSTSVVNVVECAVMFSPLLGTAWDTDMLSDLSMLRNLSETQIERGILKRV